MNLFEIFNNLLSYFWIVFLLIFIFHMLKFLTSDYKNLKAYNRYCDPEKVKLNDLKEFPLLNFIIPAWNENKEAKKSLYSIKRLNYPRIKIIINAGGGKTYLIVKEFKEKYFSKRSDLDSNYTREFILLKQKGKGKLFAVNRCLDHVNKGVIAFIDADTIIKNEYIYRHLYEIVNNNQDITICSNKPYSYQLDKIIPKYLKLYRNVNFKNKFNRILAEKKDVYMRSGCFFLNYRYKTRIKFNDKIIGSECNYQGKMLVEEGYKIYQLKHSEAHIQTDFPTNLRDFFSQTLKFRENNLIGIINKKKIFTLIKNIALFTISILVIILPIFFIFHIIFVLLFISILISFYLKRVRLMIFYKLMDQKPFNTSFSFQFWLAILLFIIIELFVNIYAIIEVFLFFKRVKRKKNIG